jgi:hypothetical protein
MRSINERKGYCVAFDGSNIVRGEDSVFSTDYDLIVRSGDIRDSLRVQ